MHPDNPTHRMRRRWRFAAVMLSMTFTGILRAEEHRWYEHSLQLYGGSPREAATLTAHDGYNETMLDSDFEWGGRWSRKYTEYLDIELSLARMKAYGTQREAGSSSGSGNRIHASLTATRGECRVRLMLPGTARHCTPWIAAGLSASRIALDRSESIQTSGGYIHQASVATTHSVIQAVTAVGIDLFPLHTGSFAITLEGGYRMDLEHGQFPGNMDSWITLIGLRLEFWPSWP